MASNCIEDFKSSLCSNEGHFNIKLLSCFHSLCRGCLEPETTENGKFIKCPFCSTLTLIPSGGTSELPNDFMQTAQQNIIGLKSSVNQLCQVCKFTEEDSDASHYCIQCKFHLCTRDAKCHVATPAQKGHKVLSHKDLLSNENDKEIMESLYCNCKHHEPNDGLNKLLMFCETCKVVLCSICYVASHEGHTLTSAKKVSDLSIIAIKKSFEDVKAKEREAKLKIEHSKRALKQMKINEDQTIELVKERGQILKNTIKKLTNEKVDKLMEYRSKEENERESSLKTLVKQSNNLEHVEDYVESCIRTFSPELQVQHFPNFARCLRVCLVKNADFPSQKSRPAAFECEDVSSTEKRIPMIFGQIEFDISDSASRSWYSNETQGYEVKFSQLYKWQGCGCISLSFNQDNDVIVLSWKHTQVMTHDGKLKQTHSAPDIGRPWNIQSYKSDIYMSFRKGINRIGLLYDRHWQVKSVFTLPPGESKMFTSMHGLAVDDISGAIYFASTYNNVVYKCEPGYCTAYPYITSGLSNPGYLCVTSSQEIVVSNFDNNSVVKFGADKNPLWTYRGASNGLKLNGPRGICANENGEVFVADTQNHKIHVLSPQGQFISFLKCTDFILYPRALAYKDGTLAISSEEGNIIRIGKVGK